MWLWREMARALRAAGITVQSGTVPVERVWSQFKQACPSGAQRMRLPWWTLLAPLCYMRFNYKHFNQASLPSFTEGDALLAERIDGLVAAARAFEADTPGDEHALRSLQAVFRHEGS